MTTPKEKARESFKRALLQATRALSARDEVDVSFGGDQASVVGDQAKIPLPARVLDRDAASIARGESDAAALWIAHHDPAAHSQNSPQGAEAQAVFNALEQARVEAIGARALKGVGNNIAASLNKRIGAKGLDQIDTAAAAPLDFSQPMDKSVVGRIIGTRGCNIKAVEASSGCKVNERVGRAASPSRRRRLTDSLT